MLGENGRNGRKQPLKVCYFNQQVQLNDFKPFLSTGLNEVSS